MPPGEVRRQALAQKDTPSQLQLEIRKRNPFEFPEQEASLNLAKSFEAVRKPFQDLISGYGITSAEYNILRILRGTNRPMATDEVFSHLLIPQTNLPEQLEQLVVKQYVARLPSNGQWNITEQGKSVLTKLDGPTLNLHRRQFANFSGRNRRV